MKMLYYILSYTYTFYPRDPTWNVDMNGNGYSACRDIGDIPPPCKYFLALENFGYSPRVFADTMANITVVFPVSSTEIKAFMIKNGIVYKTIDFQVPVSGTSFLLSPDDTSVDVDIFGRVHIAWLEQECDYCSYQTSYIRYSDGQLSEKIKIGISPGVSYRAKLISDYTGIVHIFWLEGNNLFYRRIIDAYTLTEPLNLGLYEPANDIFVTKDNFIHIVTPSGLYFNLKDDLLYGPIQFGVGIGPRITVDDFGIIHITWNESNQLGTGYNIFYGQFEMQGNMVFQKEVRSNTLGNVRFDLDPYRMAHLVWAESIEQTSSNLFYTKCDFDVCETPINISTISDQPEIISDIFGNLHITWRLSEGQIAYCMVERN